MSPDALICTEAARLMSIHMYTHPVDFPSREEPLLMYERDWPILCLGCLFVGEMSNFYPRDKTIKRADLSFFGPIKVSASRMMSESVRLCFKILPRFHHRNKVNTQVGCLTLIAEMRHLNHSLHGQTLMKGSREGRGHGGGR